MKWIILVVVILVVVWMFKRSNPENFKLKRDQFTPEKTSQNRRVLSLDRVNLWKRMMRFVLGHLAA